MSQPNPASNAALAQPRAILRGHKAQVHAAAFIRGNERLVTGDSEGFVVVWDLTIMRPRAVWRAHEDVMLGICGWGHDRLITHGRDNKMIVWRLREQDEASLSRILPLDPSTEARPQPWVLHILHVNTMNFCTFSLDANPGAASRVPSPEPLEALVAVPNTLASEAIDIYHLPSERREHTIRLGDKDGMVMALELFHLGTQLTVVAAYENGVAVVAQLDGGAAPGWTARYRAKAHSQPVLSLDIAPSRDYFLTSSADSVIAKHPLPPATTEMSAPGGSEETESVPAGRADHAAAADCDAQGSATRAAPAAAGGPSSSSSGGGGGAAVSLLSAALASEAAKTKALSAPQTAAAAARQKEEAEAEAAAVVRTEPVKTVNTKHAGQQGLRIRSDGRVFATAGWDSRVRVYSARTMKELAVLKWHQAGCYALAFSVIEGPEDGKSGAGNGGAATAETANLVPRVVDVTVKERRINHAKSAHWLAAGAKDGKVSLWEVY